MSSSSISSPMTSEPLIINYENDHAFMHFTARLLNTKGSSTMMHFSARLLNTKGSSTMTDDHFHCIIHWGLERINGNSIVLYGEICFEIRVI